MAKWEPALTLSFDRGDALSVPQAEEKSPMGLHESFSDCAGTPISKSVKSACGPNV
jgi:hypothetical protein